MEPVRLRRDDSKVIIHFDLDCFYASVVENENPALKSVPLAIQQKQIVVTCNYEARRRGLYKLQLITEAKKICPDVVIVLGEDLTRFRDASKENYNFLQSMIWSNRAERLGFDEIWIDVSDMIEYNYDLLNHNDLEHSFFCMDKNDPTSGFEYDATSTYGPTYPSPALHESLLAEEDRILRLRLIVGSHLSQYLRHELELRRGYTSTVGIATNRILSKLVGSVNKPKNQTTLVPPYEDHNGHLSTVTQFMDGHDIGRLPGVGFKLAQKIRSHILGRDAEFSFGLVYGGTKEHITVRDVRLYPGMGPETLEEILGGPGSQKGIGGKVWNLINGVDDNGVAKVKKVPTQISQEDSYMKYLYTFDQVRHQLFLLSERLIRRMHMDLMEDEDEEGGTSGSKRWLAHPRTLRLSTRPRPPLNADGTRSRTFHRISHSAPIPNFVFSLAETPSALADRLVDKNLITMFRKLHPERNGWNLSLINIAVTNMAETAAETKDSEGRDIGRMFRHQDTFLKDFRVTEETNDDVELGHSTDDTAETDLVKSRGDADMDDWQSEDETVSATRTCHMCGHQVPIFAMDAHRTFHAVPG